MAAQKFLTLLNGVKTLVSAIVSSAGAGDEGKIPALDAQGKLDTSFMPVGTATETDEAVASEALSAGDFVNLYNVGDVLNVRKADATVAGKEANGFVLTAVSSSATATVYRPSQSNNQLSALTIGAKYYLSTAAGAVTVTAPSASGNVVQYLGKAVSATAIAFYPSEGVTIA